MLPSAVLFDLDGVLVDSSEKLHHWLRLHEQAGTEPDWEHWHARIKEHDPKPEFVALAQMARKAGHQVVVLTNRPERCRHGTQAWLATHLFQVDELVMRQDGVAFAVSKGDQLAWLCERYDFVLAYDDLEDHVRLYREAGIPTVHVVECWNTIWAPHAYLSTV
jgi:phosphoglycolate phosphatase-like HAD superfamily hydrolase